MVLEIVPLLDEGTFFSEGGDMFVISTHRWTFFCSSISNLKSPTLLCKRNNVKKCQKSVQISKYQLETVFSFLIGISHSNLDIFLLIDTTRMLTFKLIFERENSNYKAECNEMFDLCVDGTKIEISRFSSDWNVPLKR